MAKGVRVPIRRQYLTNIHIISDATYVQHQRHICTLIDFQLFQVYSQVAVLKPLMLDLITETLSSEPAGHILAYGTFMQISHLVSTLTVAIIMPS